jgi:hypothetical protein
MYIIMENSFFLRVRLAVALLGKLHEKQIFFQMLQGQADTTG